MATTMRGHAAWLQLEDLRAVLRPAVFRVLLRADFFAGDLRAVDLRPVDLRALFFVADLRAVFFAGDFRVLLRAVFFAGDLRVAFFAVFFAGDFRVDFLVAFFAGDLRVDFLVAFFAVFLRPRAPPVSLLTVAQPMRSASSSEPPRSRTLSSMCSAWRFCLPE
ncbi:hypothetical protein [Lysobacter sp. Root494]|uniref:hypothetical protein n=1 Tax=Lysobacter sp. Root494 TaxID=1736549 RepID=UPI0012F74D43